MEPGGGEDQLAAAGVRRPMACRVVSRFNCRWANIEQAGRGVDGLTEPVPVEAPAAPVAGTTVDVLLVEDDDGDAVLVEELLLDSDLATRLRWVRSLKDALATLDDTPDCVVLDLNLPDGSGLHALRMILARAPEVAVLVLTGL